MQRMQGSSLVLRWRRDAAIAVLVLALAAVSVRVGFCTDDYGFRALLRARPHAFVDMFRFASGDPAANLVRIATGHLPWWTAPDLRLHLVRPLTGALFAIDVAVFGDATLGYHLQSLAWYAALLLAAARLFRRLLTPVAASFALAIFGLRAAHVVPYGWISARHLLVGGALAAWGLVLHLESRRRCALVLFALALAGSEAALAGIALTVALDVAQVDRRGWSRVVRGLAPLLVLTVLYLAVYRGLGGGARSSGDYHDPIGDPLGFLRVATVRVPLLLADAFLGIPVALATRHQASIALVGVAGTVVVGALLATSRAVQLLPRRTAVALAVAGVAGVVVGASGTLGARVLVLPDLAFAALLGVVLAAAIPAGATLRSRAGALVLPATGLLALAHLALAPVAAWTEIERLRHVARATDAIAARVVAAELPPGPPRSVFVVAASDPFVFLYPRAVLADRAPGRIGCWSTLSAAAADHQVERLDARSLRIRSEGLPMLTGFDALFRSPGVRPLRIGDEVSQCGARIRVEAAVDGRPTSLVVTFATDLDAADDDAPVLLTWDGEALRRFVAPPVSASATPAAVEIPWAPGPRTADSVRAARGPRAARWAP